MGSTIDDEGHTKLPYSIAASCQASERLELVAGCDLLPERRADFSKRWGVEAVFEDFSEMVESERPDLVAVCTTATGLQKPGREAPNSSFRGDAHAELSVALADLQVPMLYVEKAMACSMRRADEVRDAVRRNKTFFNTGVLRRFDNRYGPGAGRRPQRRHWQTAGGRPICGLQSHARPHSLHRHSKLAAGRSGY